MSAAALTVDWRGVIVSEKRSGRLTGEGFVPRTREATVSDQQIPNTNDPRVALIAAAHTVASDAAEGSVKSTKV